MCSFFYSFNYKKNYDYLKSKSPSYLLKKNINLNKNETESKMENLTHSFWDTSATTHIRIAN